MSRPIKSTSQDHTSHDSVPPSSYRSQGGLSAASLAEESIARDFAEAGGGDATHHVAHAKPSREVLGPHSMVSGYRRVSLTSGGPRPFLGPQHHESIIPPEQEREAAIEEEASLLRDNNLLSKTESRRQSGESTLKSKRSRQYSTSRQKSNGEADVEAALTAHSPTPPSESTALLAENASDASPDSPNDPSTIDQKWEEAVLSGTIETTWQREAKVVTSYAAPLMLTFFLQNSLTLTSVFTVGRLGKNELGAVALGSMTANITGYAVYHGLATSLDTLCAQAYGSGRRTLVGLQLQRMVLFLWVCTIPIGAVWLCGTWILEAIVPEKEIAEYAGLYLKVLLLGAPGYACFESGKRYVQAQGQFAATLYVLLIAAPLNVLMHWLFVWQFDWGFLGCPLAVVITENLMPLFLFLYVRHTSALECWPGLSGAALRNWWPMVRLALPGLAMVMAEFLAFEILTLASARLSATHLAAQTVLQSLGVLTYQLPFPLSVAGSTRVANLIGAGLPEAAKITSRVILVAGVVVGLFNALMLSSLRWQIPWLFTGEQEVIMLAAQTLPINAAFQLWDALCAQFNGLMRGLGKQVVGGWISVGAYYVIAIPVSFVTCFGFHWDLYGLWAGPSLALFFQAVSEGTYIYRTSWQRASEEAARRNAAG